MRPRIGQAMSAYLPRVWGVGVGMKLALSRRKQGFESPRERRNINNLGGIPKTTFRRDQTSTKD